MVFVLAVQAGRFEAQSTRAAKYERQLQSIPHRTLTCYSATPSVHPSRIKASMRYWQSANPTSERIIPQVAYILSPRISNRSEQERRLCQTPSQSDQSDRNIPSSHSLPFQIHHYPSERKWQRQDKTHVSQQNVEYIFLKETYSLSSPAIVIKQNIHKKSAC
eukprot:763583-Hanusia_phi.AAC.2